MSETGKDYTDRIERIKETWRFRKIRYAVKSYLKNLSPKDMDTAGDMLQIMIHSTVEGKE